MLGRYIQSIQHITKSNVLKKGSDRFDPTPGECSSACVFAYLGADYRWLSSGSLLGIHQFYFNKDAGFSIDTNLAVSASQQIAAQIIKFIKDSRVSISFFSEMTSAAPDQMKYLKRSHLEDLRVITNDVHDEKWSIDVIEGNHFLKIWQQSYYGENKLIFTCGDGTLFAMAFCSHHQRKW